jgi:hypothetical protein
LNEKNSKAKNQGKKVDLCLFSDWWHCKSSWNWAIFLNMRTESILTSLNVADNGILTKNTCWLRHVTESQISLKELFSGDNNWRWLFSLDITLSITYYFISHRWPLWVSRIALQNSLNLLIAGITRVSTLRLQLTVWKIVKKNPKSFQVKSFVTNNVKGKSRKSDFLAVNFSRLLSLLRESDYRNHVNAFK